MREVAIKVYTFDELSPAAKQRAKDRYASGNGYICAGDAMNSLRALANHFGGKLANYEIDWFDGSYSSTKFDMPELEPEEITERLGDLGDFNPETLKGHGDCKLTGYCADEDAIDGVRIAWNEGERDLDRLMQAAFTTWLMAAKADCAAFYENDEFSQHCEANGYEFLEDGSFYSG